MKTAVAAGMYPVGALWGFSIGEELRDNGARAMIMHPMEILEVSMDLL
jgi:phosphoglycolate phosphatase